jgi:hypothetical protein
MFFPVDISSQEISEPDPDIFIGELEYSYSYSSDVLDQDSLRACKYRKSIFRYDLKNYQSTFIGKETVSYSYSGTSNLCISETNGKKNYECEDYGIQTDSVLHYAMYPSDELIFGHPCTILEIQSKYFWTRYYISQLLRIAPDTYKNHKAYNWAFYGKMTNGGLILKSVHKFKNHTMTGTITRLTERELPFKAIKFDEAFIDNLCKSKSLGSHNR